MASVAECLKVLSVEEAGPVATMGEDVVDVRRWRNLLTCVTVAAVWFFRQDEPSKSLPDWELIPLPHVSVGPLLLALTCVCRTVPAGDQGRAVGGGTVPHGGEVGRSSIRVGRGGRPLRAVCAPWPMVF